MLRDTVQSRQVYGPQMIPAGQAIARQQKQRDLWPYSDTYAPPDSELRMPQGVVATPNTGSANQVTILTYSVPSGFRFVMTHLLIAAIGANQIPIGNPGDFTLSVDKNTPLGGGAIQGSPMADWNAIPFNIGSPSQGFIRLPRARIFDPEDVIRAKGINVGLGVGAPNFFLAMFGGWEIPEDRR